MVSLSKKAEAAVKEFKYLCTLDLFKGQGNCTSMRLFMPQINGREFDVLSIQECLMEVVIDFSLSRLKVERYEKDRKWAKLSKEARKKFRNYLSNTGELGELLLYTFLEGDLGAPQILSKMSLKTTSGDYTKGSDGIHYLKLPESKRYHLIFGEAKMYKDISAAFKKAFESIAEHKADKEFEKCLISSQIENEFSNSADRELIRAILYPHENSTNIKVSDAFGIFIGFEIKDSEGTTKTEDEYESWIEKKVISIVKTRVTTIEGYITSKCLEKSNFYVYLMPFIDMKRTRNSITKGVTE